MSILKSAPSSVRHGRASIGTVRRGGVRLGKERYGRELETVDRVLVTVPLRVLVRLGSARRGESRCGEARRGVAWQGLM